MLELRTRHSAQTRRPVSQVHRSIRIDLDEVRIGKLAQDFERSGAAVDLSVVAARSIDKECVAIEFQYRSSRDRQRFDDEPASGRGS